MSGARRPPVPPGVGVEGAKFWRSTLKDFDLRSDELTILTRACRAIDRLALIDRALEGAPALVDGRANPLIVEARMQEATLASLIRALSLREDEDSAGAGSGNRSVAARALAEQRWRR